MNFNIVYDSTFFLQALADQINAVDQTYNGDFRVSVVNVGTSSSPQYKLVISSTKTGTENDITITDSGNLLSKLDLRKVKTAQNAQITVNGLEVEKSTNQFNDVIEGMSFTAKRTGNVDVIVGEDIKPLKDSLANLVNQYNSLLGKINTETSKGGKLAREYGLNQLRSTIYR
ncbi:MAG: flagellar filament capping protein FliD [Hydrogenothermaceae bacterium]|nr:flagellar filament capping protein FliD [Hydrogenothermaceae bacterium]